jgi:hypothetical protein
VIGVITAGGEWEHTKGVGEVFILNPLEEQQLWLESVSAYFQHAGKLFASKHEVKENHNFRSELKNALIILRGETKRCPLILLQEMETDRVEPQPSGGSDQELKKAILEQQDPSGHLADFISFWEFLQRYSVIGLSLGRHQNLSLAEFKCFGLVLAARAREYLDSQGFLYLLKRRGTYNFSHLIQRDILSSVETRGTREELETVFHCFLDLLCIVQYCQEQMRYSFRHQKLIVLLTYCHHSYLRFLKVLDSAAQYLKYGKPELVESVLSIKFGLKLEIRKIFEQELKDTYQNRRMKEVYSSMESGLGLLKHASRQAFTSLVREFNTDFDELSVFQELKDQEAASNQLTHDLQELYRLVKDPNTQHTEEGFGELVRVLQDFRQGSMRVLFVKDWQPFEQFNRELETAETRERAFILHRLEVYLSTLIGEVEKRAILHRDVRFVQETG